MKKVMVLFSGGKDSLFTAVQSLEKEDYQVYLVHYENGCSICSKNVLYSVKKLIQRYGEDKCKFLGIYNVAAIFREFLLLYYNLKPSDILKLYGEIPISQFNCLACRLSMYIMSILLCQKHGIDLVLDGARKSQLFAIEQELLLNQFISFFNEYSISIEFPLKDLKDDYELKNQLLIRGIVPKTLEPMCLLGVPLTSSQIDNEMVESVSLVFNNLLKEKSKILIKRYQEIETLGGSLDG